MVVAPLVTDYTEQRWRASGIRRFTYIWELQNFNDVVVQIAAPLSLYNLAVGNLVMLTDLRITYLGLAGTPITAIFSLNPGTRYFPDWTTAATTDTVFYQNLNWILPSQPIAGNILLTLFSLNMLATDDIIIAIDGYIERESLEPVQPVSLEGYKWPLTKRRA